MTSERPSVLERLKGYQAQLDTRQKSAPAREKIHQKARPDRTKYYYITDDDSIEIGDYVVVPAGKDDHHAVVEVVNIEYFTEDDAPLPLNKTKRIIRKCTDDDFPPPEVV